MKTIASEVTVEATPERTWAVLTDFGAFREWNPFLPRMDARPEPGAPLRATGRLPIGLKLPFTGAIQVVEPPRRLAWQARPVLTPRGAFDIVHTIEVTETDGRTVVRQREDVSGWLVPLLGAVLRQAARGQRAMNDALRQRLTGSPPPAGNE